MIDKAFDTKHFVRALCKLNVTSSSKEIAAFLNKKGHSVTWQQIAGIKASVTKGQ